YLEETANQALRRLAGDVYSFDNPSAPGDASIKARTINFEGGGLRYAVHKIHVYTEPLRKWINEEPLRQDSIDNGLIIPVIPMVLATTTANGDSVSADNNYVFWHPTINDPVLGLNKKGTVIKTVTINDVVDAEGNHEYYYPEVNFDLPSQLLWDVKVTMRYLSSLNIKTDAFRAAHPGSESWVVMDSTWFTFDSINHPYVRTNWQTNRQTGKITGVLGATYQLRPEGSKINFDSPFNEQYKGVKNLPLGIKIDMGKFAETDSAKMNFSYVIPLALTKKVTFNNPDLTTEENAAKAEEVGLVCNMDTIYVGFKVEKLYTLNQLPIDPNSENFKDIVSCNLTETQPGEGSLEELFDDNPSTFWHSVWSSSGTSDPKFFVYLQFNIPEEWIATNGVVNMVGFDWVNRASGVRAPQTVSVWARTADEDWWQVGRRENVNEEFGSTGGATGTIGDARQPFISLYDDGKPHTFTSIRLCFEKAGGATLANYGSGNCVNGAELKVNLGLSD
ncbi:MAG: hypothetical protein K2M97_07885, partial [Muribaculaceae bacterium]|nr:hypothetical protein [Muribaculaceae bacterium]